jgi:WhiB family redox-sensing transcriptional regulator
MTEPQPLATAVTRRSIALAPGLDWQERSLCTSMPVRLFFPEPRESTRQAKSVCRRCDVAVECLEYAMYHQIEHGIWGGLSSRQRRQLRREARAA